MILGLLVLYKSDRVATSRSWCNNILGRVIEVGLHTHKQPCDCAFPKYVSAADRKLAWSAEGWTCHAVCHAVSMQQICFESLSRMQSAQMQ